MLKSYEQHLIYSKLLYQTTFIIAKAYDFTAFTFVKMASEGGRLDSFPHLVHCLISCQLSTHGTYSRILWS